MTYLLIRHKVKDFVAWKAAYDRHADARRSAGLAESHLMRSIDDPNEVVILFTATDVDKAKAFTISDELRSAMHGAGVVGKPDVCILN